MYQPDQARNETNAGMHFHVHQCICTSPLYNPYRQPLLAQYVPPPVARPYNLAHYQYTSYNMPYNIPVFNPNAIAHQLPVNNPSGVPESSERRSDEMGRSEDAEDFVSIPGDASTEDFTKFLEQGCVIAEKIAIRNQHRPCFKNIQNLCNRTKNEILKPSHTVSNIHSQGIPWATKDFIYAYVRLINCWHMLKGYLQAKDGTLGNIDRELTADFKSCYTIWENNTKDLAEHMIRIFSNLDNNVSNPSPNQSFVARNRVVRTAVAPISLDIPQVEVMQVQPQIPDESNQISESTTEASPREEESDCESRVYMKPGSYNVPKKSNSSDNSPPSIEFFETAKNVAPHYKKMESKKGELDNDWKNAISATPNLIKKNSNFPDGVTQDSRLDVEDVRRWLYHDNFDKQNLVYPLTDLRIILPEKPVTVLQRTEAKIKDEINLNEGDVKKKIARKFSAETKFGRLDGDPIILLLEELEKTDLNQTLISKNSESSDNLQNIIHKYNCKIYKSKGAIMSDLRRLVHSVQMIFCNDAEVLKQINAFCNILDEAIEQIFPDFTDGCLEEIECNINGNKT